MKIWKLLETRAQLKQQAIKTREGDTELARINNLLPSFLSQHAESLVSAFLALQEEYIPLVRALAPVLGRSQNMLSQVMQAQPPAETDKN
jgi:hypothetical protein